MENTRACDMGHHPLPDSGHGGHDHHPTTRRPGKKDRMLVGAALSITGIVMVLEATGGWISGSLALLSDSFHMFTHFLSLMVALGAMFIAAIPRNVQRTFGLFRAEVLAALVNGVGLIPVAVFILYEAYERLSDPTPIDVGTMLPLAVIGLVANISSAFILFRAERHDLNLRSAIAHMFADTISSVAVILVGIVLLFSNLDWLDALVSAGIAILILLWSGKLIWATLRVLLEISPKGLDLKDLEDAVTCVEGVKGIHDIHAWEITTGMVCLTAHVDIDPEVIDIKEYPRIITAIRELMLHRFGIVHTVFEICPE